MNFHPVILLPEKYLILDLTNGPDPRSTPGSWSIGRYGEKREGIYTTDLFKEKNRNIHMGIDIGCPVDTPFSAFEEGVVIYSDFHLSAGGYGYVIICEHKFKDKKIYALYGHLNKKSLEKNPVGRQFSQGEVLGWVGDESENGGWFPHLHFQLAWEKPETCDMPGVVAATDFDWALIAYPDPRLVLGAIY